MCGIFGLSVREGLLTSKEIKNWSDALFLLSESRGKEASGIAISHSNSIRVFKSPLSASVMIKNTHFKQFFINSLKDNILEEGNKCIHQTTIIGHSRLVTNGSQENHNNNQPVVKGSIAAVHNGIIVNDDHLWKQFPTLERLYDVDTEIIISLINFFRSKNKPLVKAVSSTFSLLEGTASIALLDNFQNRLLVGTNNGSLYVCSNQDCSIFIFASEAYILNQFIKKRFIKRFFKEAIVQQIKSNKGVLVDLDTFHFEGFSLENHSGEKHEKNNPENKHRKSIIDFTPAEVKYLAESTSSIASIIPESISKKFQIDYQPIMALKRCSRCILPETMPFISFDENGVCNYCNNYQKQHVLGEEALQSLVAPYRRRDGKNDCIITFSGGRDSSYCLHYIKKVLEMNPIAYTYDWGMITDLGRRNQARLCGKLGVEQILVSANIKRKREFIRKNVLAWLETPDLGTIPLFMAGDKQYFYYANVIKKQTGIILTVLGENYLETTGFKSGFCGVRPSLRRDHTYSLSGLSKLKMAFYYLKQYLKNPMYLNQSILDTIGAFGSYYLIPHEHINLFDYIKWDEETIQNTIINEYDWEISKDTKVTWRIGDGTASFYNYIYYLLAGFTENDTFRSNQIREGIMTREKAIRIIFEENTPRFDSIQWYCQTIGIDFIDVMKRINHIPRLYEDS